MSILQVGVICIVGVGLIEVFKGDQSEELSFPLRWWMTESKDFGKSTERTKIAEIRQYATTFISLGGFGGDSKEGVGDLEGRN